MKPVYFEYTQYTQLTVDKLTKKVVSVTELPLLFDSGHSLRGAATSFRDALIFWEKHADLHLVIVSALGELAADGYGIHLMADEVEEDNNQFIVDSNNRHSANPNYRKMIRHHVIFTLKRTVTVPQPDLIDVMNDLQQ